MSLSYDISLLWITKQASSLLTLQVYCAGCSRAAEGADGQQSRRETRSQQVPEVWALFEGRLLLQMPYLQPPKDPLLLQASEGGVDTFC